MSKEIFYKAFGKPLWEIKGGYVASDTPEEALGLYLKRSDGWTIDDVKPVGSVDIIIGTSDNYEDVMNIADKLNNI